MGRGNNSFNAKAQKRQAAKFGITAWRLCISATLR
jgi:hypothetical protein